MLQVDSAVAALQTPARSGFALGPVAHTDSPTALAAMVNQGLAAAISNTHQHTVHQHTAQVHGGTLPLRGCTVAFTRKVLPAWRGCDHTARSLGAHTTAAFKRGCTHLVHVGKATDALADVKLAVKHGAFVVHPAWLNQCWHTQQRVEEAAMHECLEQSAQN